MKRCVKGLLRGGAAAARAAGLLRAGLGVMRPLVLVLGIAILAS